MTVYFESHKIFHFKIQIVVENLLKAEIASQVLCYCCKDHIVFVKPNF